MTLKERLDGLFIEKPVATTAEVAEALFIKVSAINQPRAIRTRLERLGYGLETIGNNAWTKV